MANTFSYRPKNYSVDELKKIAKKHHTNLNRYIEDAVAERIRHEKLSVHEEPIEKMTRDFAKAVAEHMGIKLSKPNVETHKKIIKKFDETNKKKRWISDEVARPDR